MKKFINLLVVFSLSVFSLGVLLISCVESVEVSNLNQEDIAQEAIEDFGTYFESKVTISYTSS